MTGKNRLATERGRYRRDVLFKLAQKYAGRDEPFPLLTQIGELWGISGSEVSRLFCTLRDKNLVTTETRSDKRMYIVDAVDKQV